MGRLATEYCYLMVLVLRLPTLADEQVAKTMRAEFEPDGFGQVLNPQEGQTWAEWIAMLPRWHQGVDLPENFVPYDPFIADVDGEPVGYLSFRHNLGTEKLRNWGGHIGYVVRPQYRSKGYATLMLREALQVARDMGLDRVMVSCDEKNAASARVIEKCGGKYESSFQHDDTITRRYWIDL